MDTQTPNQFNPRKATLNDVNGISQLLKLYSKMGNLLPRSDKDIENNIEDFRVIESKNKEIIACGALERFSTELIEIRSLIVNPKFQSSGLGKVLVNYLTTTAKNDGAKRLMALTYSVGFFEKLGFEVVDKSIFPEKIWSICVNCYKFKNCDEIAVVLYL
jgi:amino-acid N-acetyltransferase